MVFLMNVKEFLKPDLKKVVLTILIFLFVPMLCLIGVAISAPNLLYSLNPFIVALRYFPINYFLIYNNPVPLTLETLPLITLTIVTNIIISYIFSCVMFALHYRIKEGRGK